MSEQPADGRFILSSPQIEVALAEVRFSSPQRELQVDDALALRDALRTGGVDLEIIQPAAARELSLTMTPEGVQTSTVAQTDGWQISDTGHQTVLTVLSSAVSVQTNRYERWSVTMRPILAALLPAVGEVLSPRLRSRIGLRYVNRFTGVAAETAGFWSTRIEPRLLGVLSEASFADRVTGSQQQLDLLDGHGRGRTIRHGCFRDAAIRHTFSYLLDIDTFDTNTESYDAAQIVSVTEELNRVAAQTFRGSITDTYEAELGLAPVGPVEGSARRPDGPGAGGGQS
jgi:uncharacterized protein (TIGR04255 family)